MITKVNSNKVLELFFEQPEKKFHIRELARLTKLSAPGVIKIVRRLKEAGFLKSKRERMVELVEADFDMMFLPAKRAYNLRSLYESGLINKLKDFYEQPQCIVLFGSYADGTDISTSDIDITIITKLEKQPDLRKYEKILKRKINILAVELARAKSGFKNSLANGIVLFGFLEVVQ